MLEPNALHQQLFNSLTVNPAEQGVRSHFYSDDNHTQIRSLGFFR